VFLRLQTYERPTALSDALLLLARPGFRPLAGGTAAVGPTDADTVGLVDLSGLGLVFTRMEADALVLGAMTTLDEMLRMPELLLTGGGVLEEAVERTGPPALLARATLGGAVARPDRAPELVAALLALDASVVVVQGTAATRLEWKLEAFLTAEKTGPFLIEAVKLPSRPMLVGLERVARTPRDVPAVSVVAVLRYDGTYLHDVRIAACGLAPAPIRLRGAEAVLEGAAPTDLVMERAAVAAATAATPLSDVRGGPEYRSHLANVLTRRAVEAALWPKGRM
jgi:carbon-monoxide dehydrogenase medium subunit